MDVVIRRALPADAAALTRVARAAKGHWGYPASWLGLWREALTVTPEFVRAHAVACAVRGATVLGFYALSGAGPVRELEHFWVAPAQIRRGVGARLLDHALDTLYAVGARRLRIVADPNAEGFYLARGARRLGAWPSTPRGRLLPLLEIVPDERGATTLRL